MRLIIFKFFLLLLLAKIANAQLITGAAQVNEYIPFLKSKNVGVVANHTSYIGKTHLVDSLLSLNIQVKTVFSPEHGFKGNYADGATIENGKYKGIPVYSLYGENKKPNANQIKNLDVIIFDMQDVGVRFYTYISTLTYVMEAAAEAKIPFIVLDRPNPNGFYIDGPVLKPAYKSFVGLHPVPVVYGMTIGEYAMMVNGEKWMKNNVQCDLNVIKLKGYDRSKPVSLSIKPSPNLPSRESIILYPSLCFFEGTNVSIGRGTEHPFEVIGHPEFPAKTYAFKPKSIPGVSDNPKHKDITCYGYNLKSMADEDILMNKKLNLKWLIQFYIASQNKTEFFNSYFNLLAGDGDLKKHIKNGKSEDEIRLTWEKDIEAFKQIRSLYLLYPDFE